MQTATDYFIELHNDLIAANQTIVSNLRTSARTIEALAEDFRFHAHTAASCGCKEAHEAFIQSASRLSVLASQRA
jgi:hypothetical protein